MAEAGGEGEGRNSVSFEMYGGGSGAAEGKGTETFFARRAGVHF